MRAATLIILLLIIFVYCQDYISKTHSEVNEIDLLTSGLTAFKSTLEPSTSFAFDSNVVEGRVGIYFQTQFAMAPNILRQESTSGDTTLVVQRLTSPLLDLSNYQIIQEIPNDHYKISLAVRK